ncbi:MAG: pilus assembly protein N-terminal domain-containing protein [Caulobacteraceae bacterium]|nr:pilus assembly protein N-terminal domain-containing protein [Caulobacter sp.]
MRASPLIIAALFGLVASGAQARGLALAVNHSARLPLSGPAQSVIVGSPSVVDVAVVDSRTVYVSGRTPGDTDVTVVDPLGRVVFHGDVSVSGGAAVSVFRGSARTDAMCAPYCHPLSDGQTLPGVSASSAAASGSMPGMGVSPQAIASVPQATSIAH